MIKEINIGDVVYVEDHSDMDNIEMIEGVVLRYEINKFYNKEGWVIRVGGSDDLPIVIRSLPEFIHTANEATEIIKAQEEEMKESWKL